MQSQKPTISITLPSTAGIGQTRIYIGQPVDQNLYNAYENPPGPGDNVIGNIIFYDGNWSPADSVFYYIAYFGGGSLAIGQMFAGTPNELISLFGNSLATTDIFFDPGYNISTETWHAVSKVNGWGNSAGSAVLSYRRVPSPAQSVQLVGRVTGGTTTSGIKIGSVPIAYAPNVGIQFPITNNANGTGVVGSVDTSGNINAFGTLTGADLSFCVIYPLNI